MDVRPTPRQSPVLGDEDPPYLTSPPVYNPDTSAILFLRLLRTWARKKTPGQPHGTTSSGFYKGYGMNFLPPTNTCSTAAKPTGFLAWYALLFRSNHTLTLFQTVQKIRDWRHAIAKVADQAIYRRFKDDPNLNTPELRAAEARRLLGPVMNLQFRSHLFILSARLCNRRLDKCQRRYKGHAT